MTRRGKRWKTKRRFSIVFPPRLEIANTAISTFPQARRLGLFQPKRPPGALTSEIPCSIRKEKSIKSLSWPNSPLAAFGVTAEGIKPELETGSKRLLPFAVSPRGKVIMTCGNSAAAKDISTRTIRKVRNRIIPLIFVLFVVAYLDRINISFAALTMNASLAITSAQFGLLTGIFFLGYFLFEIPSNLLLHKIGARIWIARILVSWGIAAVLSGFVRSAPQLYVARFLLGVAEAGFVPGILLYLTYWFPKREQARVLSLFMSAIPVSSILGAPVSGFLLDHVHWLAISSWRWLLILTRVPISSLRNFRTLKTLVATHF